MSNTKRAERLQEKTTREATPLIRNGGSFLKGDIKPMFSE